MKKLLLFALVATAIVSCTVPASEQIENFYTTSTKYTDIYDNVDKIVSMAPEYGFGTTGNNDLVDFYTYLLASKASVDTDDITYQEISKEGESGSNIIVEMKGKKKDTDKILITACIEDIPASIAAINVVKLMKECKAKKHHKIQLLLYQQDQDTTTGLLKFVRESNVNNDRYLFNMDIASCDSLATNNFIIAEPAPIYDEFVKFIPDYFTPYGYYTFEKGEMFDASWPVKTSRYTYTVDKNDITSDIAAITTLIYLLN